MPMSLRPRIKISLTKNRQRMHFGAVRSLKRPLAPSVRRNTGADHAVRVGSRQTGREKAPASSSEATTIWCAPHPERHSNYSNPGLI